MAEKEIKYIIIPDVHGRNFWRSVVEKYINTEVKFIFLGDYLDPYGYEELEDDGYPGLLDIIEYKKKYPERFILLLGNHDLHYLTRSCRGSRWDWENSERNKNVFKKNLSLFQMTYSDEINRKKYFFSHAGIVKGWLYLASSRWYNLEVPDEIENFEISDWTELPEFNKMLCSETEQNNLFSSLGYISYHRGGEQPYGSIVWADYHEFLRPENRIPGIIQVFGHTQQEKDPININNEAYCLDVRRPFKIDIDGNLLEMDNSELKEYDVEAAIKREEESFKRLAAFFL